MLLLLLVVFSGGLLANCRHIQVRTAANLRLIISEA
jgi:hypothetical protein